MTKDLIGQPTAADILLSLDGSEADFERGIATLETSDAKADIVEARRRGMRRLIGIMGYSLMVPGIEPATLENLPQGFEVVTIKGTGDFIGNGSQAELQEMAFRYAEQYNRGLLGQLPAERSVPK